jgi:hypothetical protein
MPGGFAPHTGSSVPPNKVWMSYVADKYTMTLPYQDLNTSSFYGGINSANSVVPCLYANLHNNVHLTFGGFITAPDGTTNSCQKLVEDNTNNQHYIQGGFEEWQPLYPTFRVAAIWKAADRTRICYQVLDLGQTNNLNCGFDLASGQVAYTQYTGAAASFFNLKSQSITPLPGGFYLCIIDVLALQNNSAGMFSRGLNLRFILDNGAGTAAPSLTYTGDGASGLYGWKSSVLPTRAWRISGPVFFDDFNDPTLANIDVNNTQAPGFDWYVQPGCWSDNGNVWFACLPIPPGSLSASGSVLTMPASIPQPSVGLAGGITTYCAPGTGLPSASIPGSKNPPGIGVGKGWRCPYMAEWKWAIDYPNLGSSGFPAPWAGTIEWHNWCSANVPSSGYPSVPNGGEFDYLDWGGHVAAGPGGGGAVVYSTDIGAKGITGTTTQAFAGVGAYWGYNHFQPGFVTGGNFYNSGEVVNQAGTYYWCNAGNTTQTPPSADWTVYNYPADRSHSNTRSPSFLIDTSQMNLYTYIVLPYDQETNDYGCTLYFINGALKVCNAWAPLMKYSVQP